jgi:DNA-binding CsgD family transcriptional regulator
VVVKVALYATDPLTMVALGAHLEDREEIDVLPGDRQGDADVAVVATERLSAEFAARMRCSAAELAVPVVLVAAAADEAELAGCGVVAVLPRIGLTAEQLVADVLAAASPDALPLVIAPRARPSCMDAVTARLTPREEQVLLLLADGLSTAEIAERLSYSERTVKNVFYGVTSRLNLRNRPHAVAYALRLGLI